MPNHSPSPISTDPGRVLTQPWQGPYGGVPPFKSVKVSDFKPAILAGIEAYKREIETIVGALLPASFDNTISTLEDSGRDLDRVLRVYSIWSGTMSSPDFQLLEKELAPQIAAFTDEIMQNEKLFKRIATIYQSPTLKSLNDEQQRLVWKCYTDFVRAGAQLDGPKKARLSSINQRLASLFTAFNQNLLEDERAYTLLSTQDELIGPTLSLTASFAAAATHLGLPGLWAVPNTRSSVEPFLVYSERADLRKKVWDLFMKRGGNPGAHNNKPLITEILSLRAERAKLLGYETHAHWRLEKEMAKTPAQALGLMTKVWAPALARVGEEVREMLSVAKIDSAKDTIDPWDYRFYAEKVRKLKYDVDEAEIKPYFELEGLREGMFWVAGELYDFEFIKTDSVAVPHPEVRVWEVQNKATGKHIGLWFFDPYARACKRSGAWMSSYRRQEKFNGTVSTIVSNNSNFVNAAPGDPILISLHDAKTLFHEFGHALHGLSSDVQYPSLAGTMVPRDYVEFPSQLFEDWLLTPEVLNQFALHYQTKEPMPIALVTKIKKAGSFNQGFETLEYLSSAIVDMHYHLSQNRNIDPDVFEAGILDELKMPKEVVMRHRSPHFAHIFGSDGYSAGYYSYLWADTLSASTFEAFIEGNGPYDKAVAQRLQKYVLSKGNSIDPAQAFLAFRGREPDSEALMRKRGFSSLPLA
ncbi:MAG: M3 family metallopeptidase [Chitinophagaceae bacterium]|nr:M3 family metallopeptidase [Oligoflexus sp.]